LLVAQSAPANLLTNGDFATDLSGWNVTITNPEVTVTWDSGAALFNRPNTTVAANGNNIYQIIPVVNGEQYKLDAEWKGDMTTNSTNRQWDEVFVAFTNTSTLPALTTAHIMYKKASYGGPNAPAGPWDWESILLSPNSSPVPPAGGLFTATDSYMVVLFNIGGRANAGSSYYYLDNASVTLVPEPATMAILGLGGLFLRRRLA
jgi:hypothetical protein